MENIHRIHNIAHTRRNTKMIEQCALEQFEGRIIFMSMYNDNVWENEETHEECKMNYAHRFFHDAHFCRKRPSHLSCHQRLGNDN